MGRQVSLGPCSVRLGDEVVPSIDRAATERLRDHGQEHDGK